MSGAVFLHAGLPKTGTTHLQGLLWGHRDELREAGLVLPGRRREHLWASCDLRGQPHLERRHPDAPGSWDRLVAELRDVDVTGLITHEFFAAASADQVGRVVADLTAGAGDREVHVVVTVRELVSQVGAMWQEWVKNGATGPIDTYPEGRERPPYPPTADWGWGVLDLADVLARWGAHVPPERIHVICPPARDEPRSLLWERFAGVVGVDPALVDPTAAGAYASLGLAPVELLRRVNERLEGFGRAVDRGTWIRGHLAMRTLAPLGQERFAPSPDRVAWLLARGADAVAAVEAGGYDVVGSLNVVRPVGPGAVRHPDEASDAELLDVAASAIAALLADVREERRLRRAAEARAGSHAPAPSAGREALRRVRRLWHPDRDGPTDE